MNCTTFSKKVFTTVCSRLLILSAVLFTATAALAQAPANDNACQAIVLTPDATCTYVQGTNLNATGSTGVTPPIAACGTYSGGDVWFKAVVPAGGALTFDMQAGTMTDGCMAVYSGTNCLALTFQACDDNSSANPNMPKVTVTGQVPGRTLFVRVWSKNNASNGTFGICATIPVAAPINDDPCNAIELVPGATCTYQTFTTESATNTTSVPGPVCAGFLGGDVWFKVIVPAATTALVFDTQQGVVLDGGMNVYRGSSCTGTLTELACDDNSSANTDMPKLTVGGLIPGDTVWVRFWEFENNNNGTFGICVTLPPPPPANDEPCNAIELTAGATCTFAQFTNEDATGTTTVADPGCANYAGGDVWFKVVVPAGGAIALDSDVGTMDDGGMAVYTGTCNNLTIVDCDDNSSNNGQMPALTVGGLTAGDTVWVRFWENNGDENGTFSICAKIPPPAPANDDPCGAIEIAVAATCTFQQFTNEAATGTSSVDDPTCTNYNGGDVWFKVVVPADGALVFDSQAGDIIDGGMAVYSGTCNNLTEIDCNDDDGAGNMPKLTLGGLTPGDTLWIRFWEYGGDVFGTFSLCVAPPPPPPVNDNPCTATELTVNPTCTYQTFSNADATGTSSVDDPGCGFYEGSDVWFKVVVPAGGAVQIDTDDDVMTDGAMAVYSGTCNNLTLVNCDADGSSNGDMPKLVLTGLTPGDTLWVRIWEEFNDNNGTFGICATIPPPPPANDEPCAANELTVGADCTYQTFTNESSTGSDVPDPGCANYNGGDVWFKVVVPAGGAVQLNTQAGQMSDGGMAVYSGNCAALTLITCDDDGSVGNMPKITLTGLNPGDTLWVRMWESGNDENGTFGICAALPPPPPVNDNPCTATPLTATATCTFQQFTNENATNSLGVPDPGCANYQGSDVWFSVVVPAGGALSFNSEAGVNDDGGMAIYSGTCSNLTLLDCDEGDFFGDPMPTITAGGLTPGDTIWVRFWEYGNDNNGTFGICVTIPPPGPVNDNPCSATEIVAGATCTYQTFTNEGAYGTAGVPAPGCAGYQGGDVWFKVAVPAGGALTFDSQAGSMTDGGMAVYTGTCSNLTLVECDDDDSPNGAMPKITIGGLTVGDTVWVRFWEFGNDDNGTFGLCATIPPPPPGNDNPCGAISLLTDTLCNYQTFSTEGAYGTASVPNPGCGDYQGADVWFQFIAPRAGAININTQAGTILDAGMAIYKADSCSGAMELIACDDNGSVNPDMPYITATGLTPGSTIWVRVWPNGGALNAGTFDICAVVPPLQPATFSFTCARDTSFSCNGGDSCFTLDAIIPDIHSLTDRYAINPLSSAGAGCFNPYVDPGNEGPSTDLRTDDLYTDVINLPFTFPFYGVNYNSLVASTNGYVSFDAAALATTFSHWDIVDGTTPRNLPSIDDFYDKALIMGPYHDLNPFVTTSPTRRIKYNVTGTAPHRRWILSFYKEPLFDCDELFENTHQIVLYEGTGVIEVFIFDMQNCLTWNEGRAMVGIQDETRLRGMMAPGRAATDAPWGRMGMNESWRFVPIGGPSLFKRVELFDTSGNFLATGDTTFLDSASLKVNFRNLCALQRLPAGLNTLLVRAVYQRFNDPTQEEVGADTIRIFIPNLKVNFAVANALCANPVGEVRIHAQSGLPPLRFSSDSGTTWQADSVFINLAPGRYYFKVQDNAGCARDTIVTIDDPKPINPQFIITNPPCNGDSAVVVISTNGIRPIRYSSDAGATFQYDSTFRLPSGTYTFRILDTAGCVKDTVFTFTQPAPLTATFIDSAARCNGAATGTISVLTVNGGTFPYTYSFDNNAYGPDTTLSTFAAGAHPVSIQDINGCRVDTTILITEPAPIFGVYADSAAHCNGGADGIISVLSVSGGDAPYTYAFDGGGYGADSALSTLTGGPHVVSIRDANGCTKDTTINVAQPAAILANYTVHNATCNGSADGSILVSVVSGGSGTFTYSSDGGTTFQTGDSLPQLAAGTFTVRIKDSNGCTKDTSIIITQPAPIIATYAVNNVKCFAANSGSIIVTVVSGGSGPFEFSSDGGVNYQPDDSLAVASGVFVVRIRDANGCTKDSSITVIRPDQLLVSASAGSTGCNTVAPTGNVTVSSTGGTRPLSYSKDGITFQPDSTFTGLGQNPYTITVRDANGCTVTSSVTVGVVNDLTLQTRQDTAICGEASVVLNTTTNAQTITWNPATFLNSTSIASPTAVNPNTTTEYEVVGQTGTCISRDTVKVTVTVPPVVDAGNWQLLQIFTGQDATLNGTLSANATSFTWSPTTYLTNTNTLTPTAVRPAETILYTLSATNAEGCSASDTVTVTVFRNCIQVKNAFTPNGDGVNDTWMVYDQFDCLINVKVQVFNRYGSRVFESKNYRNEWKGTFDGKDLPDATYYYVIDFLQTSGVTRQVRGDVTILR